MHLNLFSLAGRWASEQDLNFPDNPRQKDYSVGYARELKKYQFCHIFKKDDSDEISIPLGMLSKALKTAVICGSLSRSSAEYQTSLGTMVEKYTMKKFHGREVITVNGIWFPHHEGRFPDDALTEKFRQQYCKRFVDRGKSYPRKFLEQFILKSVEPPDRFAHGSIPK